MIESDDIPGIGRAMTDIALISGLDVSRMFAGGGCTIMTGGTEPYRLHTGVIKTGVAPVIGGVMAGIALFGGLDMGSVHTSGPDTVVTG